MIIIGYQIIVSEVPILKGGGEAGGFVNTICEQNFFLLIENNNFWNSK